MGETNDGGKTREPESQTREAESGVRWSRMRKATDGERSETLRGSDA